METRSWIRSPFMFSIVLIALVTLGLTTAPAAAPRQAAKAAAGPTGTIVFAAGEGGGMITRSIYVVNDDGTGRTQLTSGGSDSGAPAWSPDGTKIAYTSDPDGDFDYNIYVMNADGSGVQQLTTDLYSDFGPAWSPDGTRIAFARGGSGNYWIVTMAANGTDETEIASDGVEPHWSPDGNKIVFSTWNSNLLFVVDANGDNLERLIPDSGLAYEQSPEWSPDGSKVAFSGATMYGEIFTVGQAGNNLTQVTDSTDESSEPTWSPDGTKIAFIEGGTTLRTIGVGGAGEQTLLDGSEILSSPDWFGTPDSDPPPDNPHGCTLFVPPEYPSDTVFEGTSGDDVICGTGSDDIITGLRGSDTIYGEGGDDWLWGERGRDWVYGGAGSDFVDVHGTGKGHAFGGGGKDVLQGRDGSWNLLNGGAGRDCANASKEDEVPNVEKVLYSSAGKNCPQGDLAGGRHSEVLNVLR